MHCLPTRRFNICLFDQMKLEMQLEKTAALSQRKNVMPQGLGIIFTCLIIYQSETTVKKKQWRNLTIIINISSLISATTINKRTRYLFVVILQI